MQLLLGRTTRGSQSALNRRLDPEGQQTFDLGAAVRATSQPMRGKVSGLRKQLFSTRVEKQFRLDTDAWQKNKLPYGRGADKIREVESDYTRQEGPQIRS